MAPRIALFADQAALAVTDALDATGFAWAKLGLAEHGLEWDGGDRQALTFGGALVVLDDRDPRRGWEVCRRLQDHDHIVGCVIVVVSPHQLHLLGAPNHELFDDFVGHDIGPGELAVRLRHRLWQSQPAANPEVVTHGPIELNPETYQASVAGRLLDLTYMEYELLRFLTASPDRVFSRETLLSQVWGYEYYGGARTVDVHIRRLRAKLGEEYAPMIVTIRSVGYKLVEQRRL